MFQEIGPARRPSRSAALVHLDDPAPSFRHRRRQISGVRAPIREPRCTEAVHLQAPFAHYGHLLFRMSLSWHHYRPARLFPYTRPRSLHRSRQPGHTAVLGDRPSTAKQTRSDRTRTSWEELVVEPSAVVQIRLRPSSHLSSSLRETSHPRLLPSADGISLMLGLVSLQMLRSRQVGRIQLRRQDGTCSGDPSPARDSAEHDSRQAAHLRSRSSFELRFAIARTCRYHHRCNYN